MLDFVYKMQEKEPKIHLKMNTSIHKLNCKQSRRKALSLQSFMITVKCFQSLDAYLYSYVSYHFSDFAGS